MTPHPVAWRSWEALEDAPDLPRLVLSGHAGCPVRARWLADVAGDRLAAAYVNSHVVPVWVDRWRWPAVDGLALDVAERCGGQLGWPMLSTWLPDGRPCAATAALPADSAALVALVQSIAGAWRSERAAFWSAADALAGEADAPFQGAAITADEAVATCVASLGLADLAGHPHPPAMALLEQAARQGHTAAGTRLDVVLDAAVAGLVARDGAVMRCAEGPGFASPRHDPAAWTAAGLLALLVGRPSTARRQAAERVASWLLGQRRGATWARAGGDAPNTALTAWIARALALGGAALGRRDLLDAAADALSPWIGLDAPAPREPGVPGTLADTAGLGVAALAVEVGGGVGARNLAARAHDIATEAFVRDGVPEMRQPGLPWARPDLFDDEIPSGGAMLADLTTGLGAPWQPVQAVRAAMGRRPVGTAGLWRVALQRR